MIEVKFPVLFVKSKPHFLLRIPVYRMYGWCNGLWLRTRTQQVKFEFQFVTYTFVGEKYMTKWKDLLCFYFVIYFSKKNCS